MIVRRACFYFVYMHAGMHVCRYASFLIDNVLFCFFVWTWRVCIRERERERGSDMYVCTYVRMLIFCSKTRRACFVVREFYIRGIFV
jgi:hypothetical protein